MVWLYDAFGHGWYLILTFLVIAAMSLSIHLPFWHRQKKTAAQEAAGV